MQTFSHHFNRANLSQLRLPAAAVTLVPLRLFIGLGWLRAFVEKAPDRDWHDGTAVATFLTEQLAAGRVALPFYTVLIDQLFLPQAAVVGWLVILGQLLVGLAIIAGALTRPALLGGLWMNIHFILAGAPNPSAFYAVIQATLLAADAGTVLGLDGWLRQRSWAAGRRTPADPLTSTWPGQRRLWVGVSMLLVLAGGYSLLHAHDLSPAGSVHDPAVLLAVLSALAALRCLLAALTGPRSATVMTSTDQESQSGTSTDVTTLSTPYG